VSALVSLGPVLAQVVGTIVEVATRANDHQAQAIAQDLAELDARARRIVPLSTSIHEAVARRAGELSPSSTAPSATLGELAFTAYRLQRGGKNHDGTPTPTWTELTDGVREGWEAAAAAVRG
jgi:hypothetical protein